MPSETASARLKTTVPPAEVPGLGGLMTLAVGVVVVAGLYLAREVLIPITLAVLLSFVLAPMAALLRRIGLPRIPAVAAAVLLALGVVLMLGAVIGTQVAQLANEIPRYASTIERKLSTIQGFTLSKLEVLERNMGHSAGPAPTAAAPKQEGGPPAPIPVEVHQPDPTPMQIMERVLGPVLSPLATMGIVFVVAIFVLMQKEDLRDRIIRLFGSRDLHRTTAAMDEAAARLSRYFLTQLGLNAAFGVVVGAGLWLIGVPNPVLWGIIAALMRFVPYIGALVSAGFPMALAAAVDPGWGMVTATLALFVVTEGVTGQVIEPLVYGHSTGLSPVSVVIAAIFWAWLWGGVGLILSMPLTLCLVVLGRHIDRLEFIDVLLGDKPALTPAESFYQRLLAGDADEALDQAELLLKDMSLSAYYDQVAMKGLQLAANDSLRGVLTADQLTQILDAISGVVVDLADHKDTAEAVPDPARTGEAVVLCVAGHGPLDEAACAMLVQILGKHGIPARVASTESVSRAHIGALDLTGVRLVCVSYLEGANSMSPLRYLVRRLKQRAPHAPVMVGFWQGDPGLVTDERVQGAVGADTYVTSLQDAVAGCQAAGHAPALAA